MCRKSLYLSMLEESTFVRVKRVQYVLKEELPNHSIWYLSSMQHSSGSKKSFECVARVLYVFKEEIPNLFVEYLSSMQHLCVIIASHWSIVMLSLLILGLFGIVRAITAGAVALFDVYTCVCICKYSCSIFEHTIHV